MELNPDDLRIPERYKLLIGTAVPRPIAFVSTVSPTGEPNLAPFSFFNAVGSPVAFECVTQQVIRTNPGAPMGGNVVLGRVVHVYLRDDLVDERWHVDPDVLRAFGRMGGLGYCTTRDRFELPRGRAALAASPGLPRPLASSSNQG